MPRPALVGKLSLATAREPTPRVGWPTVHQSPFCGQGCPPAPRRPAPLWVGQVLIPRWTPRAEGTTCGGTTCRVAGRPRSVGSCPWPLPWSRRALRALPAWRPCPVHREPPGGGGGGVARGGKGRQEEGRVLFKEGVTFELFVATVTHLPAGGQVLREQRRGWGPGGQLAVLTWVTWGGTDIRTDRWARTAGPEAHPPSQHPHLSQGPPPEPPQPSLLSLPSCPHATASPARVCPLGRWSAPGNGRTRAFVPVPRCRPPRDPRTGAQYRPGLMEGVRGLDASESSRPRVSPLGRV